MIKLNKCRTLYPFNEATLAAMQPQTQQDASQTQEVSNSQQSQKNEQEKNTEKSQTSSQNLDPKTKNEQRDSKTQAPKGQNVQKGTSSEQAQTEDKLNKNQESTENKTETETSKENQEEKKESQQSQYLFFNADEFIITTYQYENGWWYGYLDIGADETVEKQMGYFPSNYVQVIEDYSEQILAEQQQIADMKDNADMNQAFTWDDYAKHSYMDDNQILIAERMKKLNDHTAPENRNPDGILGYKKIKIHESRSHAVNPWKGGVVQSGQIAIKDQSAVGKAYRQMNHYFDYDAWIDERNRNPAPKAKADPSKKKDKKKVLNW